jgi:alanine racemase
LEGVGVDAVEEAIVLRRNGFTKRILVLGWTPPERIPLLFEMDASFVVSSGTAVRAVVSALEARHDAVARIHLKVDTGLVRQGVPLEGLESLAEAARHARIEIEGLATHFANVEETDGSEMPRLQVERMQEAEKILERIGIRPQMRHMACSAAALTLPASRMTHVRVGIGQYGIWPSEEIRAKTAIERPTVALRPALAWKAKIALVKVVPAGTGIGYGLTATVGRPARIALIPVGYADGYPRHLSSKGEVLIRGVRCPVLGRICMNMFMADATDVPGGVCEGDIATLIGRDGAEEIVADGLARQTETIAYEIVARLNPMIPRVVSLAQDAV